MQLEAAGTITELKHPRLHHSDGFSPSFGSFDNYSFKTHFNPMFLQTDLSAAEVVAFIITPRKDENLRICVDLHY